MELVDVILKLKREKWTHINRNTHTRKYLLTYDFAFASPARSYYMQCALFGLGNWGATFLCFYLQSQLTVATIYCWRSHMQPHTHIYHRLK